MGQPLTNKAVIEATRELENLRSRMRGPVLCPSDEGYGTARAIFNGMIDRHPAVIARCSGVADVMRALEFGVQKACRFRFAEAGTGRRATRCATGA